MQKIGHRGPIPQLRLSCPRKLGCVLAGLHQGDGVAADFAHAAGFRKNLGELGWRGRGVEEDFLVLLAKCREILHEMFRISNRYERRELIMYSFVELVAGGYKAAASCPSRSRHMPAAAGYARHHGRGY